jgi:hypothetical protein
MNKVAELLAGEPENCLDDAVPVRIIDGCIIAARLLLRLDLGVGHVAVLVSDSSRVDIAVIHSLHESWRRMARQVKFKSIDPDDAHPGSYNVHDDFTVRVHKVQTKCLNPRCRREYASEVNCRRCLRTHVHKPKPSKEVIERLWDQLSYPNRFLCLRVIEPQSCVVNLRMKLARYNVSLSGDVLLRAIRGDESILRTLTGAQLVAALDLALEGGFDLVRFRDDVDFCDAYTPADFEAFMATLVLDRLWMAQKYVDIEEAIQSVEEIKRKDEELLRWAAEEDEAARVSPRQRVPVVKGRRKQRCSAKGVGRTAKVKAPSEDGAEDAVEDAIEDAVEDAVEDEKEKEPEAPLVEWHWESENDDENEEQNETQKQNEIAAPAPAPAPEPEPAPAPSLEPAPLPRARILLPLPMTYATYVTYARGLPYVAPMYAYIPTATPVPAPTAPPGVWVPCPPAQTALRFSCAPPLPSASSLSPLAPPFFVSSRSGPAVAPRARARATPPPPPPPPPPLPSQRGHVVFKLLPDLAAH